MNQNTKPLKELCTIKDIYEVFKTLINHKVTQRISTNNVKYLRKLFIRLHKEDKFNIIKTDNIKFTNVRLTIQEYIKTFKYSKRNETDNILNLYSYSDTFKYYNHLCDDFDTIDILEKELSMLYGVIDNYGISCKLLLIVLTRINEYLEFDIYDSNVVKCCKVLNVTLEMYPETINKNEQILQSIIVFICNLRTKVTDIKIICVTVRTIKIVCQSLKDSNNADLLFGLYGTINKEYDNLNTSTKDINTRLVFYYKLMKVLYFNTHKFGARMCVFKSVKTTESKVYYDLMTKCKYEFLDLLLRCKKPADISHFFDDIRRCTNKSIVTKNLRQIPKRLDIKDILEFSNVDMACVIHLVSKKVLYTKSHIKKIAEPIIKFIPTITDFNFLALYVYLIMQDGFSHCKNFIKILAAVYNASLGDDTCHKKISGFIINFVFSKHPDIQSYFISQLCVSKEKEYSTKKLVLLACTLSKKNMYAVDYLSDKTIKTADRNLQIVCIAIICEYCDRSFSSEDKMLGSIIKLIISIVRDEKGDDDSLLDSMINMMLNDSHDQKEAKIIQDLFCYSLQETKSNDLIDLYYSVKKKIESNSKVFGRMLDSSEKAIVFDYLSFDKDD